MNLKDMIARQTAIADEIKRFGDDIDETDQDLVDQLLTELSELESRKAPLVARAQQVQDVIDAANAGTATEAADEPRTSGLTLVSRTKRDPFDNPEAIRTGVLPIKEMTGRAMDAIELASRSQWTDFPHDAAEASTKLVQRYYGKTGKAIAQHILQTGSQEYYDSFRNYVSDPEGLGTAYRATTVGTGSLGYMLPFVLDPTIILTNSGSMNPFRQVSRVEQTTSSTWNGVTSAGVSAAMAGEAVAATDASPSVSQLQITPQRAHAWVFGSYESLEDSDLGSQLPALFADAKDRLEETNFATGAGTGAFPQGAVTAATTGNTAAVTAYAVADVYTLQGRLGPRWRRSQKCAWMGNLFYLNKTRQFDTAGGSSFWANLGQDTPERLLGKPIYESTTMSSGTATGQIALLFGDFSQYVIVDRIGMSVLYNPMLTAAATANLPTGEAGWYAFWRYGAKAATANALQALRIQ